MARPRRSAAFPGAAATSSRLDDLLIEAVFSAGAHIGIVYVLAAGGHLLQMQTTIGLPATIARTWARVRVHDRTPVAVSVREQRLVWLSDRVALAREFPAAALSVPYHFALAASPLCAGGVVWGGIVMGWPPAGESRLSRHRLDIIDDICDKMGRLLRQASESGRPLVAGSPPRILDPVPAQRPDPVTGLTALACLESLPEGHCHLDAHARVTLVTATAAELLAAQPSEMIGKRLCKALPWLDDPLCEDRYRAAVVSHQAAQFTARRPDGRWLSFQCYPRLPGVTVRITPAGTPEIASADADWRHRVIGLHDVLHLATCLARATSAQDMVNLVADHVMPACEAQAMAVLTWDGGRMHVVGSRGYSSRGLEGFHGQRMVEAVGWARGYDEGRAAFYPTWEEFQRTYPDAICIDDMGAWALLPLVAMGRSIGTCVLAYDRPRQFSDSERSLVTALGGLITQAFERAWLYDNKHKLAESLQAGQLPRHLPDFPGLDVAARYLPATPGMGIGGDFYDLIRLGDTLAGAVIGDVQGHDMTASALMGQVRTAIRAHATAGADPGQVLTHTNRLLTELAPDRFTSCLYVSFDLRRRTACLASAGHLPPVLGLPAGPAEIIDTPDGLLLGIDPDAEYGTTDVNIPPGAVMVLYTDGLVEKPGLDLGDSIAALAARFTPVPGQSLPALANALIEHTTNQQRTDDIALLLLRTTPPP
ncbi:GAF domain-containing SpoIIE family protein phosphatase [Nonomuraea sp. NPDC048882]|uniref:GAF domain-containing SpoIIE family protein phosphatase n=1 Tax=Nonomuraea sp. NPDC048882 TaxID=3154347 RepID=UPI0033E83EEF